MILYYAPGACSLADHIALEESGLKFDLAKVDLKAHALENGRDFRQINPKGYVPALTLDDGTLITENIAILSWIADHVAPGAPSLAPPGALGRYRLLEALAFISSEIHKGFKPFFTPDASDEAKAKAGAAIAQRLELAAAGLEGDYLFGEAASAADAYLFVMLTWSERLGVTVPPALAAFKTRMAGRPAVQRALKAEGLA